MEAFFVIKPNILCFGAGHSGTRVALVILARLGWNTGDLDEHGEDPVIWNLNDKPNFDREVIQQYINALPKPWVIKDTRFCTKLPQWLTLDLGNVFLLHITRNIDAVLRSYARRKEEVTREEIIALQQKASNHFEQYTGPKLTISFEQLISAAKVFDVSRAEEKPETYNQQWDEWWRTITQ